MRSFNHTQSVGTSSCQGGRYAIVLTLGTALVVSASAAIAGDAVDFRVLDNTPDRIIIQFELGSFTERAVDIDGRAYTQIALGKHASNNPTGAPDLPKVCRSIIIPDDAEMEARVLASEFHEISNIDVTPSKGPIPRTTNPADLPYSFADVYCIDADYPGELISLSEPYVLRDYHGQVVELHPFQYNPVARTLRVYTSMTVEVYKAGPGQVNIREAPRRQPSLAFHKLYQHHFLNYEPHLRYPPLDETGDMLIICHDPWLPYVQPLVDHKNAVGINTTAVGVSSIGNNATAIKSYIQNVYDTSDLAFVLLVGDLPQVATPYAMGDPSDPSYAKLAGGDDYPDIMVGRFSAASAMHVVTQVQRTIDYELMPATWQDWFWRGSGIGADVGHLDAIREILLAQGYTLVDQLYDPDATDEMIVQALNDGRGIVNYIGQGSSSGWYPNGFGIGNIDELINADMLPFIFSVASQNGNFANDTCFAEAWLRAQQGSEATGAIGAYMAAGYLYWQEPLVALDEFIDLYVNETYVTFGTLCFAASCRMIDEYGSTGAMMFDTWTLFGDPSLRVVGSWFTRGDYDHDGDVDLDDFDAFADCMTGPDAGPATPECTAFRFDADDDVDLEDFSAFQQAFTGATP